MGWPVQVVGTTGSTSTDLTGRASAGERGPVLLAARAQTAGRGRLGRTWQSPPEGSLSVSLLWTPPTPRAAWTWAPMVVGLAVLDALADLGAHAVLKWPNDVVVPVPDDPAPTWSDAPDSADAADAPDAPDTTDGPVGALTGLAKLAGVLLEVVTTPHGPALVAGVGVNLRPAAHPDASGDRRVALSELVPDPAAAGFDPVLAALAGRLESRLTAWADDPGAGTTRADYRAACSTLGRWVRVSTPGGVREGHAVDVDASGALVVQSGEGRTAVSAGDVEHVR